MNLIPEIKRRDKEGDAGRTDCPSQSIKAKVHKILKRMAKYVLFNNVHSLIYGTSVIGSLGFPRF
jgi:hypothetical protein